MKKTEKYIYLVLGLILIVVIACGITYIITTNNNETETKEEPNNNQEENNNNEEPTLEDNITLKNTTMNNDTIIQEYEIILNGKTNNLNIFYTYENCREEAICISGNYNDYSFLYNESYENLSSIFTTQKIDQLFNENNFEIIKGVDNKSYLLVSTKNPYSVALYVFNEQLDIVNDGINSDWYEGDNENVFIVYSFVNIPVLENSEAIWYDDAYGINNDNIYVKVENNKIYYLTPNVSYYEDYVYNVYNENYEIQLEERVYTINNNKFTYEVINTYNIAEVFNMI